MRRSLLFFVLASVAVAGCLGMQARERVLMPAMSRAFDEVISPNAPRISDAERKEFSDLLKSGKVSAAGRITELWIGHVGPEFARRVQERIDAGEISSGVAQSILETGRLFELNLMKLGR